MYYYDLWTMKQKLWLALITCLAYCIDKELYKATDYLREQVRVLIEHQERENKRILLTNSQRMRVAAKAKRLSRKMLDQCIELFSPVTHWMLLPNWPRIPGFQAKPAPYHAVRRD